MPNKRDIEMGIDNWVSSLVLLRNRMEQATALEDDLEWWSLIDYIRSDAESLAVDLENLRPSDIEDLDVKEE